MTEAMPGFEAGWLVGGGDPLFATYFPPAAGGTLRRHAVLLCEPLGPDRMNLHLFYRELALRFAAAGHAVLRFDPAGTGDSSGSPRDPRRGTCRPAPLRRASPRRAGSRAIRRRRCPRR